MTVKIKINGPIIANDDKWIYELFEMDATSPKDITNALPDNGENVEITINSYGGLVDEGNEIYTELMNYPGQVTVNIIMAGSAASIIAMAGKPTKISPVGQIMIHNVSMYAGGDYHDMDKASEILKKSNESLANAYMYKTGLSKEELLAKMDEETWLTSDEAVELGFADEMMFEANERPLLVANGGAGLLPPQAINKVKELKENNQPIPNATVDVEKMVVKFMDKFLAKWTDEVINGKADNKAPAGLSIEDAEEKQNNKVESPNENKSPFERFLFIK